MRVRLDYTQADTQLAGNRFFISYAGAAPTAGNCATIAADVAAAWLTHLAPVIGSEATLTEVDVLDIATYSGTSGQWNGSNDGGMGAGPVPQQVATNVEFGISRRYRGGKPRMFLPPGDTSAQATPARWSATFVGNVNTGVAAFFSAVEAISVGAVGALQHVNVSYYAGFTNHINTSGRERAVPTYRSSALVEPVVGYSAKVVMGSQRRRRNATTY
jgi:hypothetical protein